MNLIFSNRAIFFHKNNRFIRIFFTVFYIVGFFGLTVPLTHQFFLRLFPLALILSFLAILLFHQKDYEIKTISILTAIALSGYLIEVAGVMTHMIFGNYRYGNTLGINLMETPIVIGVNWIMLTYAFSSVSERISLPVFLRITVASLLMVLYDIILEQIAPLLDMWHWENGVVPLRNYIAWFLVAFIFQSAIRLAGISTKNSIAFFVVVVQVLFLVSLIIFYKLAG